MCSTRAYAFTAKGWGRKRPLLNRGWRFSKEGFGAPKRPQMRNIRTVREFIKLFLVFKIGTIFGPTAAGFEAISGDLKHAFVDSPKSMLPQVVGL